MRLEPSRGMLNHDIERAGLRKQMGCARHDLDRLRRLQARKGLLVEFDHAVIEAADNQQGRRAHIVERRIGEIGTAATRHHRANAGAQLRRSDQRRRRSGAGSEQAERQAGKLRLPVDPMDDIDQPFGQQRDIEDIGAIVALRPA